MKLFDVLRYKLLRIEHYIRMNFGKDQFGYQILSLHLVRSAAVKSDYVLKQFYQTGYVWKIGSWFILVEKF